MQNTVRLYVCEARSRLVWQHDKQSNSIPFSRQFFFFCKTTFFMRDWWSGFRTFYISPVLTHLWMTHFIHPFSSTETPTEMSVGSHVLRMVCLCMPPQTQLKYTQYIIDCIECWYGCCAGSGMARLTTPRNMACENLLNYISWWKRSSHTSFTIRSSLSRVHWRGRGGCSRWLSMECAASPHIFDISNTLNGNINELWVIRNDKDVY